MLLFISPNTVGTAFMWLMLIGFAVMFAYAVYQSNKADRQHRTK